MTPTLTDYLTGEPIRPATREEWQRSADAARTGDGTGAFTLDGRAVFVAGDFPTTGHTPEPWRVGGTVLVEGVDDDARAYLVIRNGNDQWPALVERDSDGEANAARIVQCVNALAGVRDPGTAIRQAREALLAARGWIRHGDDGGCLEGAVEDRLTYALALLDGGPK